MPGHAPTLYRQNIPGDILSGAVIGLEFALDRSSIGDGTLYTAYVAVLGGYILYGCTCAQKRLAV